MTQAMTEQTAAGIARRLSDAIPAAERVTPVRDDGGRFASFDVELTNGQQFTVQVEEL